MRERLIELITEIENNLFQAYPYTTDTFRVEETAKHLLANGVIVPPCKVGDTVYQVDAVRIYPSVVNAVIYDTDGIAFDERAIGKTVFLTPEEAERALKECEQV